MTCASVEIIFGIASACASDSSTPTTFRRGNVRACSSDMPANFEASTASSGKGCPPYCSGDGARRLRSARSIRREVLASGVDARLGGFAVLGGIADLDLAIRERRLPHHVLGSAERRQILQASIGPHATADAQRSEEHTSELQSLRHL